MEKEGFIIEKESRIKELEKENLQLKEKVKKYKNVIKHYDENFNFSFVSNINQESDLHNINIMNLGNNDDSHILTEQTLIELKNDFNSDYEEDEFSSDNNRLINFNTNRRFLSERLDETENLNEINICENYFIDRSILNVNTQNNTDNNINNNIDLLQINNYEVTNTNSAMTTLTNFHNFSERTINIEEMTYEELIDMQDRIGYANRGLTQDEIKVKFYSCC